MSKTPGQIAYEADCESCPTYQTGQPRKAWHKLPEWARWSWEISPRFRTPKPPVQP